MSGGLRTSVKGYLLAQRVTVAPLDPVHEIESTNITTVTADSLDNKSPSLPDSSSHSLLPNVDLCCKAEPQSMAAFGTRIKVESLSHHDGRISQGPLTPQTEGEILHSFNLKNFRFNELKRATMDFRRDHVVGGSDSGHVYKGWMDVHSMTAAKPGKGMAIAIKKSCAKERSLLGHKEWLTEVNCRRHLAHPNVVELIGYGLKDSKRFLVYEYMPQRSLDKHLLRSTDSRDSHCQLSWDLRMKIALGAAKGLAYLHSDKAKVMYGNFRSSKILLDSNYNAKLYGYGLAEVGFEGYRSRVPFVDTYLDDRVFFTPVYMYGAPEYMIRDDLTPKSDVYSFGVVLLEILSGKLAFYDKMSWGEKDLFLVNIELAKMRPSQGFSANKRKVERIFDAHLEGQYTEDVAIKAVNLAMHCLSIEPELRPDMNEVVQVLEQLKSSI